MAPTRPEAPPTEVDLRALAEEAEGSPVVKMVNLILVDALTNSASDVTIEPGPEAIRVRQRINGVLEDVLQIPKWARNAVIARLKVMAGLDITEHRIPQDGRLRVRYESSLVDFRLSALPTANGERIVMRARNAAAALRQLDKLGLSDRDLRELRGAIRAPHGLILVAGPSGSGKTTTLYAAILELRSRQLDVFTVENPIEYKIDGVSQAEVNDDHGCATTLASVLSQDPDVVVIGNIGDRETAAIALRAASGRLVLATVDAGDSVSAVSALVELGVERSDLASSLLAVVAQRLVRVVCPRCAEPAPIPEGDVTALGLRTETGKRGRGCAACRHTGFASQVGVYEVLRMTSEIESLIEQQATPSAFRLRLREQGMRTLRDDAAAKIETGLTTPGEVRRAVELSDTSPSARSRPSSSSS